MNGQFDNITGRRLTTKLIGFLFLFSIIFTLIHSGIDLNREFSKRIKKIDESFIQIENTVLKQISFSLWQMDDTQLKIQLESALKLEGIVYIEIIEKDKILLSVGKKQTDGFKEQYFNLDYSSSGISKRLGKMHVQASYANVRDDILNSLLNIIVNESFKFFVLAFLLLILVHKMIMRHLLDMARYTRNLNVDNLDIPLVLDKKTDDNKFDVLDSVCFSINKMRKNILSYIDEKEDIQKQLALSNKKMELEIKDRIKAEEKIKILNEELEEKVFKRTEELEESNEELQITLSNLESTQGQLIQSEKMASLGVLVAGVAHEINTPVGMGLTGITHFLDITTDINKMYSEDKLSQEDFEEYLRVSMELGTSINVNLVRAADLIRSFKQVAVDQSSEVKRIFNLKKYLEEILITMNNITKKTKIKILIDCPESLNVESFPGSFSQIITNLVMNSLYHGYEPNDTGLINIRVKQSKYGIVLTYTDDGKGIKKEILPKIYDPFFTTNREKGGSGLGLNIIYNIVTTTLGGTIVCNSDENKGVEFIIELSLDIVDH